MYCACLFFHFVGIKQEASLVVVLLQRNDMQCPVMVSLHIKFVIGATQFDHRQNFDLRTDFRQSDRLECTEGY